MREACLFAYPPCPRLLSIAMILKQSRQVSESVRASFVIGSFSQIAEELIANAIDAGATNVECSVDFRSFAIEVRDNGCGMLELDLQKIGCGIVSSKFSNTNLYGFRGEALHAISTLACVNIITKPSAHLHTFQKRIDFGSCGSVSVCDRTRSDGTTMTVTEIFREFPVRRTAVAPSAELSTLKQTVLHYALANPSIGFSLFDMARSTRVLQTPKASSSLPILSSWLGVDIVQHLVPVRYEDPVTNVRIEGYLSHPEHLSHNKDLQCIYINRRLVVKTDIHSLVTSMFTAHRLRKRRGTHHPKAVGTAAPLQPIFILAITCPAQLYDISYLPNKSMAQFTNSKPIVDLLREGVRDFLRVKCANPSALDMSDDDCDSNTTRTSPPLIQLQKRTKKFTQVPNDQNEISVTFSARQRSNSFPLTCCGPGESLSARLRGILHKNPVTSIQSPVVKEVINVRVRPTEDIVKEWKNPVALRQGHQARFGSHSRSNCNRLTSFPSSITSTPSESYVISKEDLRMASLVGQVDRKFLLVRTPSRLVLIDQHAADERVRLERFEREIMSADPVVRSKLLGNAACHTEPITISAKEHELIKHFSEPLKIWGWKIECHLEPYNDTAVCRMLKCPVVCGHIFSDHSLVKSYLHQLQTHGITNYVPVCVREALASKACRGAVMFGDELTTDQAQSLLASLAACNLPFICAHGRPSVLATED